MQSRKRRRTRRDKEEEKNLIAVRAKLWLEINGKPFFGEGRVQLLKGIDKYGSINQAAKAANMSYRRAWSYLHAMEKRLGIKMLNTRVGGPNGGGTELSKEAREFLQRFEEISSDLEKFVEKEFAGFFNDEALCYNA